MRAPIEVDGETLTVEAVAREIAGAAGGGRDPDGAATGLAGSERRPRAVGPHRAQLLEESKLGGQPRKLGWPPTV